MKTGVKTPLRCGLCFGLVLCGLLALLAFTAGLACADLQDFAIPLQRTYTTHCWEDRTGAPSTAKLEVVPAGEGVQLQYTFTSPANTQVHCDWPVETARNYTRLDFNLKGDASGNLFQVWLGDERGKWLGQGAVKLDFATWRHFSLPVKETWTPLVNVLRCVLVQQGGLGEHVVELKAVRFTGEQPLPPDTLQKLDLHVYPAPLQGVKAHKAAFEVQKVQVAGKTVVLLDGEPLFCVLDFKPDEHYVELARKVGVNCFALDWYWRGLEPVEGYRETDRLRAFLASLREAGIAVILLVNDHPPKWVLAQRGDEPVDASGALYPGCKLVRQEFGRFLRYFVKATADFPNVIGYGVSTGGEADSDFREVNGQQSPWRASPALLKDWRAFLKAKYERADRLQHAWQAPQVTFATALPPAPLGPPEGRWLDFRTAFHDWKQFTDSLYIKGTDWQGALIKTLAPEKLVMVRVGWPVFQGYNPFLFKQARHLDMLQDKDAVAPWEAGSTAFLSSRVHLFASALYGTGKVNFPEVDVAHGRGRPSSEEMTFYLPPLGKLVGGFWYYRGLAPDFVSGLADAVQDLHRSMLQPRKPLVGVCYSQKYANWCQSHVTYDNEESLAGIASWLDAAHLEWCVVSEYNLERLQGLRAVVCAGNEVLGADFLQTLEQFAKSGRCVVWEQNAGLYDLHGHKRVCPALKGPRVYVCSQGLFERLSPRAGKHFAPADLHEAEGLMHHLRAALE